MLPLLWWRCCCSYCWPSRCFRLRSPEAVRGSQRLFGDGVMGVAVASAGASDGNGGPIACSSRLAHSGYRNCCCINARGLARGERRPGGRKVARAAVDLLERWERVGPAGAVQAGGWASGEILDQDMVSVNI